MSLLASLLASIVLNAAHPVEKIDLGPACEGGYPTFEVRDFSGKPTVRISYATHPDGLGERGDFWRETAARYLGEDIDLPILPANIDRYEFFSVDRKGTFRAKLLQGLVRYVRIALEKPADGAAVTIDGFRLDNDKVHSVGERQGSFTCSDERLNRVWEASVRTCELSAIPSYVAKHVTPAVTTLPYLADGAKRDRLVWSGDLWWAERNMFYGFRTDEPYMRGSIRLLAANRTPEGYVQACPWPEQKPPKGEEYGPFPSDEFAAWFIPVLWDYHLYRDDRPLLAETWTLTRDLVNYLKRHVRADGIFEQRRETSKHAAGLVFGGTSCHHRSYMNILLWFTYVDAAKIAAELGHAAEAETWRRDAEKLAPVVRANFWDAEKGHFVLSMEERKFGQEANALALSSGFATAEEAKRIMPQIVRIGHGKFQAIAARGKFMYGDAKGALAAIEAHGWYKLVDPSWPGAHLTSECTHLIRKGWGDEAHPDTAIAGVLSAFVLGVEPLEPGYRKFRFDPPAACGIDHASGRVPTPHGEIVASWHRDADGKIVTNLTCPAGTECVGRARPMPAGGICAHRGDQAEYPENTVPAFKAAVEKGAAMVEFDVHRCKTGELIVMHDNTIDRTTTGKGRWCDLTFAELRAADAGVKRGERFRGVKIPTFDEAIDCFPKDGVWLNVHCDDSVTDEVARKIKEKGRLHQAFIAAGAAGVARARAAVPEIKVCLFALPRDSWTHSWTAEERRASIAAVIAAKAEFTQPHNADFTQDELHDYHARGGKVNYFWCNDPSRLPALLASGVDFPLTDNLAEMMKAYNACLKRPLAPANPKRVKEP